MITFKCRECNSDAWCQPGVMIRCDDINNGPFYCPNCNAVMEVVSVSRPLPEKPKDFDELKKLVENDDIEILLLEDMSDGTTHLLIKDNRRTYGEGELYEIVV